MASHTPVLELKDIFSYRNLAHAVAGATVSIVLARAVENVIEFDIDCYIKIFGISYFSVRLVYL